MIIVKFLKNTYVLISEIIMLIMALLWFLDKHEWESLIVLIGLVASIITNVSLKIKDYKFDKNDKDKDVHKNNNTSDSNIKQNTGTQNDINHDNNYNPYKYLPKLGFTTTSFFYQRMCYAFPGISGLSLIDNPKIANQRLGELLKSPLLFRSRDDKGTTAPIWWFRGLSSNSIESYKRLSKTKCLINYKEIEIDKLYVFRSNAYYQEFVYVLTKSEKQTGIYNFSSDIIKKHIEDDAYFYEEYGLYKKYHITRKEYDDGRAVIKRKIVDVSDAALRVRFLIPYNFIITPKFSPINEREYDLQLQTLLDNILKGYDSIESLINFLKRLKRNMFDGEM